MRQRFYRWPLPVVLLSVFLLDSALADEKTAKAIKGPLSTDPVGTGHYLQMMLGLVFVVALIIGLAWFMRRMGNFQTTAAGALKILGGVSVGQRERVLLLQAGDTQLLLGVAPGQIRTLHVLDEPIISEPSHPPSGNFAEKLHKLLKQRTSS